MKLRTLVLVFFLVIVNVVANLATNFRTSHPCKAPCPLSPSKKVLISYPNWAYERLYPKFEVPTFEHQHRYNN